MAAKKGQPLWLVVTLFLLLAALLAIAMMSKMSDVRTKMALSHKAQHAHKLEHAHALLQRHKPTPPQLPAEAVHQASPVRPAESAKHAAGIALIIDDVGYNLPALQRILRLDVPVAISIIPDALHARQAAIITHRAKQMVMLHLPMQPEGEKYRHKMNAAFLQTDMNEPQLRSTFLHDLSLVPYVQGVNNHMGSALTQMQQPMRWVMQLCREHGLFFVDSKTTAKSVAYRTAAEMGLERASRQFFLDDDLRTPALLAAWEKVRTCARKGHRCIIIGHPHPQTISFLENYLSAGDRAMIVPLKSLLHPASAQAKQVRISMAIARQ